MPTFEPLTERDRELIEVALTSAASACQGGRVTPTSRPSDPLAREYLSALRRLRKQPTPHASWSQGWKSGFADGVADATDDEPTPTATNPYPKEN